MTGFNRTTRRSGFLIIDMVIGMILLSALGLVLAVGVRAQQRGAMHLNDSRAAMRAAEAALVEMQSGAAEPSARRGVNVRVINESNTTAPVGYRWVRIEATCNGRAASIYGLVGQRR
jgi:type II secretory pathway pseudopilin PulG